MRTGRKRGVGQSKPPSENVVRVPHDSVNEMVLIAAVIVDQSARDQYLRTIRPEQFHGTGHALIWRTLQEMYQKGLYYDPATLRQMGGPEVDVQYVEGLVKQRPALPPNLKHHVEMLHWDHARVTTAEGPVTRFLEMLKDTKTDPATLRSAATAIASGLAEGNSRTLRNNRQLIDEQAAKILKRLEGQATYPTGIPGLDYYGPTDTKLVDGKVQPLDGLPRLVPGLAPGNITTVTGTSGSGKTTTTAIMALALTQQKVRVAYGAYEQGSGMTLELLATLSLGMSRTDVMTGRFSREDHSDIVHEMEAIGQYAMFDEIPFDKFATRDRNPNAKALDRIAQAIIDSRCEVYIADLFKRQLSEVDADQEELALTGIQHIAKQLNVHIILVQQQKLKELESTRSKLPRRDLIKGSSAWVDVSDQILGWHRPALWKNVPDDVIYSLVLKQRFGPWPVMVEHRWDPEYSTIEGGTTVPMQREGDPDEEGADLISKPMF